VAIRGYVYVTVGARKRSTYIRSGEANGSESAQNIHALYLGLPFVPHFVTLFSNFQTALFLTVEPANVLVKSHVTQSKG